MVGTPRVEAVSHGLPLGVQSLESRPVRSAQVRAYDDRAWNPLQKEPMPCRHMPLLAQLRTSKHPRPKRGTLRQVAKPTKSQHKYV